jgi:hypothetical protein
MRRSCIDVRRAVGRVPTTAIREVVTCRERITDTAQHDRRDHFASRRAIDTVGDALHDLFGERVLLFGPIDRDDRDAVALFVNHFVAHRVTSYLIRVPVFVSQCSGRSDFGNGASLDPIVVPWGDSGGQIATNRA